MSWIVTNWRLKLLSLVLAVGLVGAVAFSQNPPVFDTVAVHVEFANLPQDLVVLDPPTSIDVPVAGLRDTVTKYKNTAAGVTINLANAKPGPNQVFAVTPRTDVPPDGVAISSKSTFGSGVVSLRVVTVTVWVAWPSANVTVPEAAT